MALAIGIIIAGSWAGQAQAQTVDCYQALPGCLDSSFGVNGRVTTPADMKIAALAIQNITVGNVVEQRIVAVGTVSTTVRRKTVRTWKIARYLPNGQPDISFGSGGSVQTTFPYGNGLAHAVIVQPDNKLLVAGEGYLLKSFASAPMGVPVVARYQANGALDASFGSGGMVGVPYGKHAGATYRLALQTDGKIVATNCYIYTCRMGVFRLSANGKLDTSFNSGGTVPGIYVHEAVPSNGNGIGIQTVAGEERIVVAGHMLDVNSRNTGTVWRFTSGGLPDTSFGGSGWITTDFFGYASYYYAMAVDASDRVLAVGYAEGNDGRLVMARYQVNGDLDSGFGIGGTVLPAPRLTSDGAWAVAIQSDQRILLGGESYQRLGQSSTSYTANWRFDATGWPDYSFGTGGWVTTDSKLGDYGFSPLVLQTDGKFVTAGGTALARYYQ
ncbi:MAG: hypothetical protein ACR2IF_10500 [Terriglobales bacterium]